MGKPRKGSNAINVEKAAAMVEHSFQIMLAPGQSRKVKEQIVDMALNGSGIRDTARVLQVSTSTVIKELKKRNRNCNK